MEDNKQELQVEEVAEQAPEAEQPEAEATENPAPAEQALTEELAEIDLSEVDMPEQDFDLDEILKEFGNGEAASVEKAPEVPEAAPADPMAGDTVRLDTVAIRGAARNAAPEQKRQLELRIRALAEMYRETREVALVLERYYDRRYWKNERYTL